MKFHPIFFLLVLNSQLFISQLKYGSFGIGFKYDKGLTNVEIILLSITEVPIGGQINTQPNPVHIRYLFQNYREIL